MKTRMLVEIGVMSVLVFLFDLLSHLLPIPGTTEGITLYMIPIFLISFKYGVKAGLLTGITSSLIFLIFGHFHSFTWPQYILDYIIALGVLSIAGVYSKNIRSCGCNCEQRSSYIVKGVFFGVLLKAIVNFTSVLIFINEYFEHGHSHVYESLLETGEVFFALVYTMLAIVPSAVITAIILVRSFKKYGNKIIGL